MSRILAISDIHGHIEGFKILLDKAKYSPGSDQLFLLGDFIDRDPKTWRSLEFIKELTREGAKPIAGNMERRLVESKERGHLSFLNSESNISIDEVPFDFIHSLPLYIDTVDYLFVHAGIRPGIQLNKQIPIDLTEIREDFWENDYPFVKPVVFGHTPTHLMGAEFGEIWMGKGMMGIDTGAKHGLRLSLVDFNERIIYSCATGREHLYSDLRIKYW